MSWGLCFVVKWCLKMREGKEIGNVSSFFWEEAASHSWPGSVCQEMTWASRIHANVAVVFAVSEGGRVRLGGGPQDFQCFNTIGNKIQVNFWMEVERSQGVSSLTAGLSTDLLWVSSSSWVPERRRKNENFYLDLSVLHFYRCGTEVSFVCLFLIAREETLEQARLIVVWGI